MVSFNVVQDSSKWAVAQSVRPAPTFQRGSSVVLNRFHPNPELKLFLAAHELTARHPLFTRRLSSSHSGWECTAFGLDDGSMLLLLSKPQGLISLTLEVNHKKIHLKGKDDIRRWRMGSKPLGDGMSEELHTPKATTLSIDSVAGVQFGFQYTRMWGDGSQDDFYPYHLPSYPSHVPAAYETESAKAAKIHALRIKEQDGHNHVQERVAVIQMARGSVAQRTERESFGGIMLLDFNTGLYHPVGLGQELPISASEVNALVALLP